MAYEVPVISSGSDYLYRQCIFICSGAGDKPPRYSIVSRSGERAPPNSVTPVETGFHLLFAAAKLCKDAEDKPPRYFCPKDR